VTRLLLTTHIRAPRARCFDLARSVELHTGSAASPTLTSRITAYERPAWFRDSMVRGAFARLDHDHRFRDDGHGGTVMDDVFEFAAPYGPLGLLAERLLLAGYFRRFLNARNRHLKAVAESEAWRSCRA
jgi:ligand-binding SRPBCC domain-containing protein